MNANQTCVCWGCSAPIPAEAFEAGGKGIRIGVYTFHSEACKAAFREGGGHLPVHEEQKELQLH